MVQIPKKIFDEMIAHLKSCHPQEGCGFLLGKAGAADVFVPIDNMERSSVSYSMDPKHQLRAFTKMRDEKKDLVAIVHSHVASPAVPSQKDKALATYEDVSYVIVSLSDMKNPEAKAWRIAGGKEAAEELAVR